MKHRILRFIVVLNVSLFLVACQAPQTYDVPGTVDTFVEKVASTVAAVRDLG